MGAVDYWCNAFTPERLPRWQQAIDDAGLPLKIRTADDDSFTDPARMVERMDELGIDTLVLVVADPAAWARPHSFVSVAAASVGEVEALARRYPGRFVGQWSVDPETGSAGVRAARAALDNPWIVGLHLHTHSFDRAFDHADLYPYYSLAGEYDVPVVMQAGTSGGLSPSACGQPIGIDRPAIYFPDVRFVLSHTGWPWVDEAIAMALKFPNVYLGTAVYPARHWSAALRDFVGGAGRRKTLYGTGFPAAGHRHTLAQIEELGLGEQARANYLGKTARTVFPRLAPPAGTTSP